MSTVRSPAFLQRFFTLFFAKPIKTKPNLLNQFHLMRKFFAVALALTGCLSLSLHSQERLLKLLDAETDFVAGVRSIPDLAHFVEGLSEHTVFAPVFDEAMISKLWAAISDGEYNSLEALLDETFQMDYKTLLEVFNGGALVAIMDFAKIADFDNDPSAGGFLIAIEHAGITPSLEQIVERLVEHQLEIREDDESEVTKWHETQEFSGVPMEVVFSEWEDSQETMVLITLENALLFTASVEDAEALIEQSLVGAGGSLAQSNRFLDAAEEAPGDSIFVYADFERFWSFLYDSLSEEIGQSLAQMGLSFDSIYNALALDALEVMRFGAEVGPLDPFEIKSQFHLGMRAREGIFSLLTFKQNTPLDENFIPAGVDSVDIAGFNISEAFANLERLINQVNPFYGGVIVAQLDELREQTGVDLRRGLLENFGDSVMSFGWVTVDETEANEDVLPMEESLFVFDVVDSASLVRSIEALKDIAEGFAGPNFISDEEHFGHRIFLIDTQDDSPAFALTVAHGRLIAGSADLDRVRNLISRIEQGEAADSGILRQDWLLDAFERIAADHAVGRSYLNVDSLFRTAAAFFSTIIPPDDASLWDALMRSSQELGKAGFVAISETSMTETSYRARSLVIQKEP